MSAVEKAAADIIKLLDRRSGFDEWWSEIARQDREEILGAIEQIIWETHDP